MIILESRFKERFNLQTSVWGVLKITQYIPNPYILSTYILVLNWIPRQSWNIQHNCHAKQNEHRISNERCPYKSPNFKKDKTISKTSFNK